MAENEKTCVVCKEVDGTEYTMTAKTGNKVTLRICDACKKSIVEKILAGFRNRKTEVTDEQDL